MRISRIQKYIFTAIGICLILLILKDMISPVLMQNATYGMSALIEKGSVKHLFIGSSMFKQGLDADVLDESLDDWYLLAYNGNQPVMEAFELEYLLSHGVKIENLYVDMYAYTAFDKPKLSDEKILMDIPVRDKCRLYKLLYDRLNINDIWRFFITANNDIIVTWPVSSKAVNNQFYKGASRVYTEGSTGEYLDTMEVLFLDEIINEKQVEGLKRIVELSKEYNINLEFIETPKYKTVSNHQDYKKAMDIYSSILKDQNTRFITMEESDITLNSGYFMDLIHLSSKGRKMFTEQILLNIG